MKSNEYVRSRFSRRDFIKTATAGVSVASLSGLGVSFANAHALTEDNEVRNDNPKLTPCDNPILTPLSLNKKPSLLSLFQEGAVFA
jgi:hypothetical protein